jgi:DEAD/DEAH box helicase domain-containing protein
VRAALESRGIEQLYTHQARAFELASAGRDIVVATPTASGKSLCYNLPVLECLSEEPEARALYMFPTKALSRDQEEGLRGLLGDVGLPHGAVTYDGDTPADARRAARERSGVILTNPDMLHAGILPHHTNWARLFANLRYVVIDELHTYRGVFGSHLANVLRRLQRAARFHGSDPTFVLSSATIGNPGEHASRLLGRKVEVVDESGAPSGPRRVLVYNPPVVNAELGIRQSYLKAAVRMTCDLVRAGVSTLVFGQSRNGVEVMLKYLRDRLARDHIPAESIHAYRGGYLPETRRNIEAGLREGQIRCVVATNALELGIDVGALDAVVCAGYPGTVSGLWQRFGRAGRRQDASLSLLVTSSAPLDQFVAQDASYLTGAPIEQARIDPDNVEILVQHLKCAAFEIPFEEGDDFGNLPPESLQDALGFLADHEVVHPVSGAHGKRTWHWATDAYPANHVSLRSASWDNFVIIDLDGDRTIGEMDWRSVHTMLHEQAIYQHGGEQYQVERLDYENHKAFVRGVKPDYYTTAMTHTRVSVLEDEDGAAVQLGSSHALAAGRGEISVVEKVVGYKKIKYHTHENVGYGDVHLPEMQMHTSGFWLTFPEKFVQSLGHPRPAVVDALRGLMGAMHTVASVGLMVDPRDLGQTLGSRTEPEGPPGKGDGEGPGFDPTIFLYDHIAGGIGLAPRLFDEREALLARTRALIEGCGCGQGCPACIGPESGEAASPVDPSQPMKQVSRRALVMEILDALGVRPHGVSVTG